MQTQTIQLRVTLPFELQAYLQTKASRYGLNMSAYVKNLIINDVKELAYPTYQASKKVEDAYQEAKTAEKKGELVEVDNLEEFLTNL